MAQFELSLNKTLAFEGGYVYVPATGECSNWGVTHWTLRRLGYLAPQPNTKQPTESEKAFVRSMTREFAAEIYRVHYWNAIQGDKIQSQAVADKVFDLAVNLGVPEAVKLLQQALGCMPDGELGPVTLRMLNAADATQLLARYRSLAEGHYREIAVKNRVLANDLPGWLDRLAA